jgi:hypothetical protein
MPYSTASSTTTASHSSQLNLWASKKIKALSAQAAFVSWQTNSAGTPQMILQLTAMLCSNML